MYQFEKINKGLLVSQVEEEIYNYIIKQPLNIGDKIPNEYELTQLFGVGRSTVREAVKSLASKGILEVRRGSGTFVISTSFAENDPLGLSNFQDKYKLAIELLDVRLMIEPEIASRAAELADDNEKKQLDILCKETEKLYMEGKNHIPKDIEFHTCIARCSKNSVVETLIPIINTAVMTFANLTYRTLMNETIYTHRTITDAIIDGDAVGAKCAMIMHLTYNRQKILELMKMNTGNDV